MIHPTGPEADEGPDDSPAQARAPTIARPEPVSLDLVSLERLTERLLRVALTAHQTFEVEVWRGRGALDLGGREESPSYHNEGHIRSVVRCVELLFRQGEEAPDPLGVGRDLQRWNSLHPGLTISHRGLGLAVHAAFSCHDLGNIARSSEVGCDATGEPTLALAPCYDSSALYPQPVVELRSAEIAEALLERLADAQQRRVLAPLLRHLVLQTVFLFERVSSDEPFWLLMQTVDMVGSYFFSPVSRLRSVAGLFNEIRVQKDGLIRVAPFLGSLQQRFLKLVPDPARQEEVLRLLEQNGEGQDRVRVFALPASLAALLEPLPFLDAIRALLRAERG